MHFKNAIHQRISKYQTEFRHIPKVDSLTYFLYIIIHNYLHESVRYIMKHYSALFIIDI